MLTEFIIKSNAKFLLAFQKNKSYQKFLLYLTVVYFKDFGEASFMCM